MPFYSKRYSLPFILVFLSALISSFVSNLHPQIWSVLKSLSSSTRSARPKHILPSVVQGLRARPVFCAESSLSRHLSARIIVQVPHKHASKPRRPRFDIFRCGRTSVRQPSDVFSQANLAGPGGLSLRLCPRLRRTHRGSSRHHDSLRARPSQIQHCGFKQRNARYVRELSCRAPAQHRFSF